jgi:C1A family cysteine protease
MPDPRQIRGLGWKPDLPDQRDILYSISPKAAKALPASVDLRAQCPPIYDQGRLGSCTANAIAGAIEFEQMKQQIAEFTPSRLFIYYNEHVIEHSVLFDSGAQIRDGIKSVVAQGVCPETMWTYDDTPPANDGDPCASCKYARKPDSGCYTEAKKHKVKSYHRLPQTEQAMKDCLASGYPFIFGFTCYNNLPFQSNDGVIPLPEPTNKVIGGHAIMAVGYDDGKRLFTIRNSWGKTWGVQGYGFMSYDYLSNSNLSDDFWTVRLV